MSSDLTLASIIVAVQFAIWGWKILLAYAISIAAVLVICGLVRCGEWLWDRVRRPHPAMVRIDTERDAAVRDLIALRQQAVRHMVEVAHDEFIEGTATEVERRR